MQNTQKKKRRFSIFPAYSDRMIFVAVLCLVLFGSFMIASAEMGSVAGDSSVIVSAVLKQMIFVGVGFLGMVLLSRFPTFQIQEKILIDFGFAAMVVLLLLTRLFPPVGGAYGWIRFGSFTIQPSEFAKVYVIVAFSYLLSKDKGPETNKRNFRKLIGMGVIFLGIILVLQKDLGSAAVLTGIGYVLLLCANRKEFRDYQMKMLILLIVGIVGFLFLLSPFGTKILENFGGYQVGRFLASANPFLYQYDSGYHLIMGLVSFATGGLFGLGYGKSIHKYMNFPNPSNDFILPVIVEELGIVFGFIPILILYGMIMVPLIRYSLKTTNIRYRLVFTGVFMYLALHFVLNVGGVSGIIPLTGVPLLLLSSGGSSTLACMAAIGIAQEEIIRMRKEQEMHAHHSREI